MGRKQTKRAHSGNERLVSVPFSTAPLMVADTLQAYHFRHAYDASNKYGSKTTMPKIQPKEIGFRDVVIVEANVARFRCEAHSGKALYDGAPWGIWRTSFNIVSICRLQRGNVTTESSDECSDHAGDTEL